MRSLGQLKYRTSRNCYRTARDHLNWATIGEWGNLEWVSECRFLSLAKTSIQIPNLGTWSSDDVNWEGSSNHRWLNNEGDDWGQEDHSKVERADSLAYESKYGGYSPGQTRNQPKIECNALQSPSQWRTKAQGQDNFLSSRDSEVSLGVRGSVEW